MFQSTFPRGERVRSAKHSNVNFGFNPRSHEGNDLLPFLPCLAYLLVSIHVPTRGTTVLWPASPAALTCFNPRSHEGNDITSATALVWILLFQSTFPRGERQDNLNTRKVYHVFQSTFPRGERHNLIYKILAFDCFNPRSHEGNDISEMAKKPAERSFNPRSHEGNDI